ncbi:hypothetical protein [Candidatus Neptunochlamydia vexilliferae]|uniref:Uncharacterized protein n=1 Tax=Candidatus Neptunichlamydia vexilliferae TaxID=1651774 RepID=A0ABS0AWY4_9BACT|nr:hypothetical protein [Candidatus Neptunochlamydia vexilliferae]MBF5058649.1 hypothetical protein [Candidatus Neptunochlamydia vexilliferae]
MTTTFNKDLAPQLENLNKRLYKLEETENVKNFMTQWALQLDKIEYYKSEEHALRLANNWMTPDGTFKMPFGVWGPDKKHIVTSFLNFAKDPDVMPGSLPNPKAEGIKWAVHYYFHQSVELFENELNEESACFTAREMVPLMWNGQAKWLFLDNDSTLKKVDATGDGKKEWRMHEYGLKGINLVDNTASTWTDLDPKNGADIFSFDEERFKRQYGDDSE